MKLKTHTGFLYFRLIVFICLIATIVHGAPAFNAGPSVVNAQAPSCPDLVKKALESADKLCSSVKRNQACYGNALASASPRAGVTFTFTKPGDIVDLKDLQTLKMTAYDPSGGTWGVAIMRVQANLPDTAPGQNVTMVVFGDAQVDDATKPGDGNKPMQAFYLRTGIGSPGCKQVSQDGMLLKSPEGDLKVALTVDGVQLNVGSTVFLAARPVQGNATPTAISGTSTAQKPAFKIEIHTIKGSVSVTANGKTKIAESGTVIEEFTTEDFEPVGEPSDPEQDTLSSPDFIDALPIDALDQTDQELNASESEEPTVEPGEGEITPTAEGGEEPTVEPSAEEGITPEPGSGENQSEPTNPPDSNPPDNNDSGQP